MTDSGFTKLPPGGRIFDLAPVPAKPEQTIKIESARGDLRDVKRATRIEGEVTAVRRDGTATIRTESGAELDIKLRGRITLQEGQKVEIDLPPGSPPHQAVIRPAPETPAQQQQPSPSPAASQTLPPVVATPSTGQLPPPAPGTPAITPEATPPAPPPVQHGITPSIPTDIRAILDELSPPLAPLPQPASIRPIPVPLPVPVPPDASLRLIPLPDFPAASALLPPPPLLPATPTLVTPAFLAPLPTTIAMPDASSGIISGLIPAAAVPVTMFHSVSGTGIPLHNAAGPSSPLTMFQPSIIPANLTATTPPLITTLPDSTLLQMQPLLLSPAIQTPSALIFPEPTALPQRMDVRIGVMSLQDTITLIGPGHNPDPSLPVMQNSTATPATLHGQIVGITPQHLPVLSILMPGQAEATPFLLQIATSALPVGTQLELLPQTAIPAAASPSLPSPFPALAMDLLSGWTWPVFDEMLDVMTAQNPGQMLAAQSLAQILPNPANPVQMTPAILFFVAAIRAGDPGGWMGEKSLNALKREGKLGSDLLAKLTRDFTGLSKMLAEPLSQDWRGMAIPYLWQNEIQKMNLYFRHQGGEDSSDSDGKKDRSTRFIFDLHLDRMGDVQLDGLMKGPRFDLILRTRTPFTHAMQIIMRQKYLGILEVGNLHGDLAFQTRKDQWVRVEARLSGLKTTA